MEIMDIRKIRVARLCIRPMKMHEGGQTGLIAINAIRSLISISLPVIAS